MGIEISISDRLSSQLKSLAEKYPKASNIAARKAGFFIQAKCIKDFLSVSDGEAGGGGRKATARTMWPGLRTRTGALRRSVKVGVYQGFTMSVLSSQNSFMKDDKFLSAVAVGIGDELPYGTEHERYGRRQSGLQKGVKNYFPFLEPAMKASERDIERIFDQELTNAERASS